MSLASNLFPLLAIAAAVGIGLVLLKARTKSGGVSEESYYKPKPLLTAKELEFLLRLEAAVPELRFCPQVAMGALLEPAVSRKDRKVYYRLRGAFSQKIVDFVAQERSTGTVVAVIELDDRTHDSAKDAARDAMLGSAGYRVVRWHSKNKPDATAMRATLLPSAPAATPVPAATAPAAPSMAAARVSLA